MLSEPAAGARRAARVILIDADGKVLFLRGHEPQSGATFWVMPGGGLRENESFEAAAAREAFEETGQKVDLGPCVWFRHHGYLWNGKPAAQYERFYVAHLSACSPCLAGDSLDSYISTCRWWTVEEIQASRESFAPRRAGELLRWLVEAGPPAEPLDAGV